MFNLSELKKKCIILSIVSFVCIGVTTKSWALSTASALMNNFNISLSPGMEIEFYDYGYGDVANTMVHTNGNPCWGSSDSGCTSMMLTNQDGIGIYSPNWVALDSTSLLAGNDATSHTRGTGTSLSNFMSTELEAATNTIGNGATTIAMAERYNYFHVITGGTLTLSADYSLSHLVDLTENTNSFVGLFIGENSGGSDERKILGINNQTQTGNINISLEFGNNEDGYLGGWLEASLHPNTNPVPEPSTFLLIGTGLAGVLYLKRKKI